MPVTLNTFAAIANVAKDNQSIFVKHDSVKAGTSLHRASTFRASTTQFLEALTNEYGTHMGELATKLLQHDLEAGKPLKAAQVKAFIALGRQHAAKGSLDAIRTDRQTMQGVLREMYGDDGLTLTDSQYGSLRQLFGRLQSTLVASAHLHEDHAYDDIADQLGRNKLPLVKTAADLILGREDCELVHLGYPREQDPQLLQDKLKVLTLIAPLDAPRVDSGIVFRCMVALEDIRQAKPAPAELNGADLFAALFPEELTPTMKRPSPEEVALYTPRQMQELFKRATDDYLDNFKVEHLPPNSIFRGKENGEFVLMMAKSLNVMPQQLLHATEDRVTLKDFPLLQGDNFIDGGYETLQKARSTVCMDMPRRGTGLNDAAEPPVISFTSKNGETTRETVGARKFADGDLSEDAELYRAGRPSTVSDRLFDSIHALSKTPAQEKALTGALTQMGVMPLKHMIQCFGEYMNITEHSKFDYVFRQNDDDSVDVTITTGEELKGFNGTGELTYHVEPDGRSGITDFQWDRPTVQERKDAILNCQGNNMSGGAIISQSLDNSRLDIGNSVKKMFVEVGKSILADSLNGLNTHDELPTDKELRTLLSIVPEPRDNSVAAIEEQKKKREASTAPLDKLALLCQYPPAVLRALPLPPAQQAAFCKAVMTLEIWNNEMAMEGLLENMDQLMAAQAQGPLTPESLWPILFNEPLPAELGSQAEGSHKLLSPAVLRRQGDIMFEKSTAFVQRLEQMPEEGEEIASANLYMKMMGRLSSGIPEEVGWQIEAGNYPRELTLNDLGPRGGFVHAHQIHDVDGALGSMAKDLSRMGNEEIQDLKKELPNAVGQANISISLPAPEGGEDEVFAFDPKHPEGLSPDDLNSYMNGHADNALMQGLKEKIVNYCGKDHPEQACAALLALGQGGQSFTKTLADVFHTQPTEHASMTVSLTHDDDHNIHVSYSTLEGCPLNAHWEFVFGPNGEQTLADFNMRRADA